jgi:solute:Na+ symporter, SSS family
MQQSLIWIDYAAIALVILFTIGVAVYFTKAGGKDMESFFVSGRSLPWYVAGASLTATSFAADTPLWVTSLVRQHGIHFVWQFWAPFIGAILTVVYFGRRWRRMALLTDVEFVEARYGGGVAKLLRGWGGAFGALIICPLICGWVIKAMETISREALGLSEDQRIYVTVGVVVVAIVVSTFGGLSGVVYSDFFQLILATVGTLVLAVLSVAAVGGLDVMVEKLRAIPDWSGNNLAMIPEVGLEPGQLPMWDVISFILIGLGIAVGGGYNAQRLLACKDSGNASGAQLLHSIFYYALMPWPWIVVALCSMVLIPHLPDAEQGAAYPRMLMLILPVGLRGLLIAALLAAFISTITTLFNWGSSYLMNDIFRRFIKEDCNEHTYVVIGRFATVLIAAAGATISLMANSILELLALNYVLGAGTYLLAFAPWLWWRMNRYGAFAAFLTSWAVAIGMLVFKIFDAPLGYLMGLEEGVIFSSEIRLTGARMLLAIILVTFSAVAVSLLTPPEPMENLKKFLLRARPFSFGWKPVIRELGEPYDAIEDFGRTLLSWVIGMSMVLSLLYGVGQLLIGSTLFGIGCLVFSALMLGWTLVRLKKDNDRELEVYGHRP